MWSLHPTNSLLKAFLKRFKLPFKENNSIEARIETHKAFFEWEKLLLPLYWEWPTSNLSLYYKYVRSEICFLVWKPSIFKKNLCLFSIFTKIPFATNLENSPIQVPVLVLWWGSNCVYLKSVGLSLIKVWAIILGLRWSPSLIDTLWWGVVLLCTNVTGVVIMKSH